MSSQKYKKKYIDKKSLHLIIKKTTLKLKTERGKLRQYFKLKYN